MDRDELRGLAYDYRRFERQRQRYRRLQHHRQQLDVVAIGDTDSWIGEIEHHAKRRVRVSLSPTSRTVTPTAVTGSVSVTAGGSCSWTAASSSSWLTITGSASGSGNGTINYSVAANSGTGVRSGTITVGSATFTVTQNGSCVYTVTPKNHGFNPPTATGSVTVTTSSSCSWTATRSGSWITITSGASGSGNGTVRYRVSANTGSSSRTGTLTVAGEPVILTQSAATAPHSPAGLRIINVR